jgi:hypothetical protein
MGTHGRREIHTHEVSVLKVEPIELIACLFGVVDVLVYDECGALGVVCDALADLTAAVSLDCFGQSGSESIPDGPKLAKEVKELFGSDVVAIQAPGQPPTLGQRYSVSE